MKKQIIITLILLIATAYVTVVYFKNLNPPGMRTSQVMQAIPDSAPLIFEFNNDQSFYEIFQGNTLFASVVGEQKITELDTLRHQLLQNSYLAKYFLGQNLFISVHPSKTNSVDLLLTISSANGFESNLFEQIPKNDHRLLVTPLMIQGRHGYNIYISSLKKRFYVINKEDNILSGSFSRELIEQSAAYKGNKEKTSFVLLSEQQSANSLASFYINYKQLAPFTDQFFINKNTDIIKSLKLFPALSALSLNYRNDALMFNGTTNILSNEAATYLTLFAGQQPIVNHLKDILPSTTAYSINFALSDPLRFCKDLEQWQIKAGLKDERKQLFDKIKTETGSDLKAEFNDLLGNEFAVVTTRYFEKFAVVSVSDGSKLKLFLTAVSTMNDENTGELNYDKVPFFLLGDVFNIFKRPYFTIIDNYLVLANSAKELTSFNDSYINRKFLSKNNLYNQFDNLLSAKSNVAFFFNFKNLFPILDRDVSADMDNAFKTNEPGMKDFYGASLQFSAADKSFYTNFCIKLNNDTTVSPKLK